MDRLEPEAALALWAAFPVDRQPRPIVLMSFSRGPGGAPMLEDKTSVLRHAPVISDVSMPPWLLEALQPDPTPHWQVDPVRVRSVRRAYPEFRTDRGHRPLPAYRIEFVGPQFPPGKAPDPKAEGIGYPPMHVLDPAVRLWWPDGLSSDYRGGLSGLPPAVLTGGGRTVHWMVHGSPPEYTDIWVDAVHESRTAVVLVLGGGIRPGVTAVPLVGVGRLVIAKLAAPLAGRVLLQTNGIPIEVVPA
ncbi:hypothetical protein ACWF0M_17615 [Kribbella sp. NPDC055110]